MTERKDSRGRCVCLRWAWCWYSERTGREAAGASGSRIASRPCPPPGPDSRRRNPHGRPERTKSINVKIYSQAAPAVANIVTRTLEYDVFMEPVPVEGAGSGFVIDPRGYILTNFHVVQGAQAIAVTLGDRSHFDGEIYRRRRAQRHRARENRPERPQTPALTMGDSDRLQVGQRVLAIGNPFGFQSTLTTGVVSALGRTVQTSETTVIDGAIQTDAAINQGNSGGPLLNSHGEVIGINSAIYTPSGTTAGIGFAIPISTARIAQDLISEGRVRRASMGVEARVLTPVCGGAGLPVSKAC